MPSDVAKILIEFVRRTLPGNVPSASEAWLCHREDEIAVWVVIDIADSKEASRVHQILREIYKFPEAESIALDFRVLQRPHYSSALRVPKGFTTIWSKEVAVA